MSEIMEPDYFEVRRFRTEVPDGFLNYPITADRDGWLCSKILPKATQVLEIGAGDRPFLPELKVRGYKGNFRTMDVDRRQTFDYYSVEEIDDRFDAVIMREVIEHLPRELFYAYLKRIWTLLVPGGILLVTTPNPWSGTWFFCDYTHVSPWPPRDLYAVLRWHGFSRVEVCRTIWPSKWIWLKRVYWAVHSRLYDIDFAGGYAVAATK